MSNAILPLVLLGSMGSSAAAIAYGIQTEWEFLGIKKEEPEPVYTPPVETQGLMGGGSMASESFVIQGNGDDDDMSIIDDENAIVGELSNKYVSTGDPTSNIAALAGMPVNCGISDGDQTALRSFKFVTDGDGDVYKYNCSSISNPGDLKFGNVGNYVTSRSGTIDDIHSAQALCSSNQALVGFVLDQNSSGTKAGYKYDCINLKGPAKVRTALSAYKPYDEDNPSEVLKDISAESDGKVGAIECNEGELLQGFAAEKSGSNMRYIYRCVTPGYEED
jgi:hypothetical protein